MSLLTGWARCPRGVAPPGSGSSLWLAPSAVSIVLRESRKRQAVELLLYALCAASYRLWRWLVRRRERPPSGRAETSRRQARDLSPCLPRSPFRFSWSFGRLFDRFRRPQALGAFSASATMRGAWWVMAKPIDSGFTFASGTRYWMAGGDKPRRRTSRASCAILALVLIPIPKSSAQQNSSAATGPSTQQQPEGTERPISGMANAGPQAA